MSANKTIVIITLISFLFWSCRSMVIPTNKSSSFKVENVRFKEDVNVVYVYYDLVGESKDDEYTIDLLVSLNDNKMVQIPSSSATGNIGKGQTQGNGKKIKWNVLKDFPDGLNEEEIQFFVNAKKTKTKKSTWLYITSGIVLLTVGIVTGLILTKDNGSNLPLPPSRPTAIN